MRYLIAVPLALTADILRFEADLLGALSRKVVGR